VRPQVAGSNPAVRTKKLYMKKELKNIIDQIVKNYKPKRIILFGSRAKGSFSKVTSDFDLAIIKRTKDNFIERLKKIAKIVKTWEAVDILVYTPKEWQKGLKENHYFIEEIAKGKVLYEK
jgi:predicted nucleotidyltransferase